jgi:ferritin
MLISKKINQALNQQIGNEFAASMQYIAIAAHFDAEALPQLAQHFYQQGDEERLHAMKFVKYILDAGGVPRIPDIAAPVASFKKPSDAVRLSLDRELEVTKQINKLVELAKGESDYTTDSFLQWFVNEQLEEVSSMDQLLKIMLRAGDDGLLRVEEYLARGLAKRSANEAGGTD